MNASHFTIWAEYNDEDQSFFDVMTQEGWKDLCLNNEFKKRKKKWAQRDKPDKMKNRLPPVMGTFYMGPWARKGWVMKVKESYERLCQGVPRKQIHLGWQRTLLRNRDYWGTSEWSSRQPISVAIFDHFFMKTEHQSLVKCVRGRRVKVGLEVQSAPSDHAPVDLIVKCT